MDENETNSKVEPDVQKHPSSMENMRWKLNRSWQANLSL